MTSDRLVFRKAEGSPPTPPDRPPRSAAHLESIRLGGGDPQVPHPHWAAECCAGTATGAGATVPEDLAPQAGGAQGQGPGTVTGLACCSSPPSGGNFFCLFEACPLPPLTWNRNQGTGQGLLAFCTKANGVPGRIGTNLLCGSAFQSRTNTRTHMDYINIDILLYDNLQIDLIPFVIILHVHGRVRLCVRWVCVNILYALMSCVSNPKKASDVSDCPHHCSGRGPHIPTHPLGLPLAPAGGPTRPGDLPLALRPLIPIHTVARVASPTPEQLARAPFVVVEDPPGAAGAAGAISLGTRLTEAPLPPGCLFPAGPP